MSAAALHDVGVWLALADTGLAKYASVADALARVGAAIMRNRAKDQLRELVRMDVPPWRQAQKSLMRKALEQAKDSWQTIRDYATPEEEPEETEPEETELEELLPEGLWPLPLVPPKEPELSAGMLSPASEKEPSLGEAVSVPTHALV